MVFAFMEGAHKNQANILKLIANVQVIISV